MPALHDGVSCRDSEQSGSAPEAVYSCSVLSLSLPQNEYTLHLTHKCFQAGQLHNLASSAVLSHTLLEVLLHTVNKLILKKAIH